MNKIPTSDIFSRCLFSEKSTPPLCLIDTSTLIYLERLTLLERIAVVFPLATIDQVIKEFGRSPKGVAIYPTGEGVTDMLLVKQAVLCDAVVLSEDKKVLQNAGSCGLEYYNTLMIVLALYARGEIDYVICTSLLGRLEKFARYGENVWTYGRQVLAELCRKNE